LILTGDCPVAEIALQCGFAHQSHLASWMRRRLGITPSSLMGERQAQRGSRKSTSARR
ncbi:AraC family transcriptional regulator, partial [Pseudomonas sp. FW305-130]